MFHDRSHENQHKSVFCLWSDVEEMNDVDVRKSSNESNPVSLIEEQHLRSHIL